LILLILINGNVWGQGKIDPSKPIKIALSAPFTGLGSILGDYIKQGALLAIDEINAAGGVAGAKFDLVVYDDQANASTAATVVRRALFDDRAVAIFGPNMSAAVIGVHTSPTGQETHARRGHLPLLPLRQGKERLSVQASRR